MTALFSNIVALGYKIVGFSFVSLQNCSINNEKRVCKLAITYEMAYLTLKSALGY
jgi:hypothetical protein